jgi:hypothetical protein
MVLVSVQTHIMVSIVMNIAEHVILLVTDAQEVLNLIVYVVSKTPIGQQQVHVFVTKTTNQQVVLTTLGRVMFFARILVQGHGNIIVIRV